MRIALLADGVYPYDQGGHQVYTYHIAKRFAHDHEVDLYVQRKPDIEYPAELEGVSIVEVKSRVTSPRFRLTAGAISYARTVPDMLHDLDYDIVDVLFCCNTNEVDTPSVATYGAFLQRWFEISGIRERIFNSIPTAIQYYINRRTLGSVDSVVALSERSKEELESVFSPTVPTGTIEVGIDEAHFTPDGATASLPEIAEFTGVFVGRLHDEKGVFELLEAIACTAVDIGIIFVGTGPARDALEKKARNLGIADRIAFEGFVDYEVVPRYYRAADVCFLPSYFEIQPLTCIETMACGTPIIASDIAGVRELVTDEYNGLLVPPSSVNPLVAAIERMISSTKLYERLVENGLDFAKTRSWDNTAEQLLDIYCRVDDDSEEAR